MLAFSVCMIVAVSTHKHGGDGIRTCISETEKEHGRIGPFPIGNLNLYKPFDIFPEQSEDEKARGRQVEINNGRLAMLGLISLLTESNGLIVPPLDGIENFPKYAGNVMIPFSADFSLY